MYVHRDIQKDMSNKLEGRSNKLNVTINTLEATHSKLEVAS